MFLDRKFFDELFQIIDTYRFEDKLWQAADKLRGHMDPSEYKQVVLGLIFLK